MARHRTVELLNSVSAKATSTKRKFEPGSSLQVPATKVRTVRKHPLMPQGDQYEFPQSPEPEPLNAAIDNSSNSITEGPIANTTSPTLRRSNRIHNHNSSNLDFSLTAPTHQQPNTPKKRVANQQDENQPRRKQGRPRKDRDRDNVSGNIETENTASRTSLQQKSAQETSSEQSPPPLNEPQQVDATASSAPAGSNIDTSATDDAAAQNAEESPAPVLEDAQTSGGLAEIQERDPSDFEAVSELLGCGQDWRIVVEAAEGIKTAAEGERFRTSPMKSLCKRIRKLGSLYEALYQAYSKESSSDVLQQRSLVKESVLRVIFQISEFKSYGADRSPAGSIRDVYFHIIPTLMFLLKDMLVSAHQNQIALNGTVLTELCEILRNTRELCVKAGYWDPRPAIEGGIKKNVHKVIKPRLDRIKARYETHLDEEEAVKAAESEVRQTEKLRIQAKENATRRKEETKEQIATNRRAAELCIAKLPMPKAFYMRYSSFRGYATPVSIDRLGLEVSGNYGISNGYDDDLFIDGDTNSNETGKGSLEPGLNMRSKSRNGVFTPPPAVSAETLGRESPEIAERTPLRPLARKLAENRPGRVQLPKKEASLDSGWEKAELEALILGLQLYSDPQNRYWDILKHYGNEPGDPLAFRDAGDMRQQAKLLKHTYLNSEAMQRGERLEWLLSVED